MHYSLKFLKNSLENNGFLNYIKHPEMMLRTPAIHTKLESTEHKPNILHGLWITNENNPKKINSQLENFLTQAQKAPDYKVVFWSNINADALKEMNPELNLSNVEVRNINTISTNYNKLLDIVVSPKEHFENYNNLKSYNGFIIDLTKYLIIESEGGILADLNFSFGEKFNPQIIQEYDFIGLHQGLNRIENGLLISKPHHDIFKDTLNIIEEMMFSHDCALEYLKKVVSLDSVTELFSMMPLSMAYIKNINNPKNHNALLSHGSCKNPYAKDTYYNNQLTDFDIQTKVAIQDHDNNIELIDSQNWDEFTDYAMSYYQTYRYMSDYENFNCIESELVGKDSMSVTWWSAGILV